MRAAQPAEWGLTVKWVYLATAPDQLVAEMWRDMLAEEGVAALVRAGDTSSFLGVSAYPCRLLVAEHQLERAEAVMRELGQQPTDDSPTHDP
jgi:hypothetical protein